jgi:cytochrome c-type biogenesis protein CcmH/NrfG
VSQVLAGLAVAILAAVAAAGVTAGFRRRDPVPIEAFGDPLEDRRLALARSIADLEEARTTGALEEADYARLRGESDGRLGRLLEAIDRRASEVVPQRIDPPGPETPSSPATGRVPAWAVATVLLATVVAVVGAGLLRDVRPSSTAPTATGPADALAAFEQRVRDHPRDLAARLDLAHRYLDLGRLDEALAEYAVALELDPDDAEAHAHVAIVLSQAGRPEEALVEVDRALATDPTYPEALFVRGVILLRELERPAEAIDAFEAYLAAAPFGAERGTTVELIAEAAALAG